mgnify:CR=1 FL=1
MNNLDPKANPAADDWSQFVGGRVGAESLKVLLSMSQTRTTDVPLAGFLLPDVTLTASVTMAVEPPSPAVDADSVTHDATGGS